MAKSVNTRTRLSSPRKTAAKLPHERDESVGMTGDTPSRPMQQAHRDLSRGLQDTDRGAVADSTYRKLKEVAPVTQPASEPVPKVKSLDQEKADFTSEGSPPPGMVAKNAPVAARRSRH